jgi:hypothetical protein
LSSRIHTGFGSAISRATAGRSREKPRTLGGGGGIEATPVWALT